MSDDRLHRIENKIDKIDERINRVDVTLSAQHVSLKEHMRRTDILEQQLAPIKKHVDVVQGVIKLVAVFATMAAIAESVVAIMEFFK